MKAKKTIELVENMYWKCHKEEHRHRFEKTAQCCIDQSAKAGKSPKRWSREELFKILEMKNACNNASALARELGMSATNLNRLAGKAERIKRREESARKPFGMLKA